MRSASPTRIRLVGCLIVLLAAGCQTTTTTGRADSGQQVAVEKPQQQPRKTEPKGPNLNTDPCAMRLHDIAGALLLYYQSNHRLPARLDELPSLPGDPELQLVCPVSKTPYVYDPRGILMPETKSRVVIYDPAPSHFGVRWAVTISQPDDEGAAMVTKVIALPETTFRFQPAIR